MKKIFPLIVVLISISLIGIIVIQVSWLNYMVEIRKVQYKNKLINATTMVGAELTELKGSILSKGNGFPWKQDEFSLEMLKPTTVGSRLTTAQINEKIKKAFAVNELANTKFEFGLASITSLGQLGYIERQSTDFLKYFEDSTNCYSWIYPLTSPTGSISENLSPNEILMVIVPHSNSLAIKSLKWRIAIVVLFTAIIFAAFYLTLYTMLRQKKLSEIKNDFINNMTHEFKTPLATISLAVDAMKNEKVLDDKKRIGYFSGIIKEENQRMNLQVETILKAALLERQEVDLMLKPTHVHDVIKDVADNFTLQLEEKMGKIDLKLNADKDLIEADEVHFPNLINNLLDNAVKYSKDNAVPEIKITTSSNEKNISIRLEDNGIGMSKETLKKIFEKFYRAHTGNVHNVKGFGLGLSYVKTMVEAQGGNIKADSLLGKGSSFTIEFPLKKNHS